MSSKRLTQRDRELLLDCAQFVLAGEWPWTSGDDEADDREREQLKAVVRKLGGEA